MRLKMHFQSVFTYLMLVLLLLFSCFPIYWIVNTSLKTNAEIYRKAPTLWPERFVLDGFRKLFDSGFSIQVKNSLIVSISVSFLAVFISLLAAYAIARMNFRGRKMSSRAILYAYLLPNSIMFIPLYMVVTKLGLMNSIGGLIFIYPTFVIPYATWMLVSYLKSISMEIEESAIVDGCTRLGAMFRIVLPLAAPGIASTLIFSFTLCWNEFFYALILITDNSQKTITIGLSGLIQGDAYPWAALSAGAILTTIPVFVLYMLASRFVSGGLTAGAIKA